jgi:hypothetical protein
VKEAVQFVDGRGFQIRLKSAPVGVPLIIQADEET